MRLVEVPVNHPVRLVEIEAPLEMAHRLRDLGFLKGIEISIKIKSPFSGPYVLDVAGASVVMRKNEAELIVVEEVP